MDDYKDALPLWCSECAAVVEYECLCPSGNPKFPLVTREEAMRLGNVQRDLVGFLSRCGARGGYIAVNSDAAELRGYSLEQVERAAAGLLRRRIIRREGFRMFMVDPA